MVWMTRVQFPGGNDAILFFFLLHPVQLWGPLDLLLNGYWGTYPGVKWPGCEADHSPLSSAKVKNAWSYTSTPQYVFMLLCLVKHRDNFTFTFSMIYYSSETYLKTK
jgi:hypothetical protein